MSSLIVNKSTAAGRAGALLGAVYGQYVPSLEIKEGDKLSYTPSSGSAALTSLADVASALFEAAGKSNDAVGTSDESKQQVKSWLERIGAGKYESEQDVKALDKELESRTFLVGESATAADLSLFASVHPYIASATHSAHLSHPAVSRHFDQIQHLPELQPVLGNLFTPAEVKIDVDNVPVVEIKQEAKVKKPKAPQPQAQGQDATGGVSTKAKGAAETITDAVKGAAAAVLPTEVAQAVGAAPTSAAVGSTEQAKKPKKEKKEKEKKAPAPAPVVEAPAPWQIDLRVGKIVDVKVHPDADSLYVEQIDVGEPEPRTVVSGLVKYMTLEQMRGATLITVCNLKPASMRGVKSFAMVLCASAREGKDGGVEFVNPPAGSLPGDRVYFEGFEDKVALELLNPKRKIFETVQPGFTTLDTKEAAWVSPEGQTHKIVTAKGVCAAGTFVGASLS